MTDAAAQLRATIAARPHVTPATWRPGMTGFYCVDEPGLGACEYQGAAQPYALSQPRPGITRHEVRTGDQHPWDADPKAGNNKHERCETTMRLEAGVIGQPVYYMHDFMIEPGPVSSPLWCVIGQAHQAVGDRTPPPPPFGFQLEPGDRLAAYARSDANANLAAVKSRIWLADQPVVRGRWYRLELVLLMHPAGGLCTVRLDGGTVAKAHQPFGYLDQSAFHFARGIYRDGPTKETLAVQYGPANLRPFDGFFG